MKDSFEQFVRDNREEFDNLEPDISVWKRLKKELSVNHSFRWYVYLRRAAVVIVIFTLSYFANEMVHRFKDSQSRSVAREGIPGLNEAYYINLVNQKLDELKPVFENCPSLREELNYDLSELDSVYADLKRDLKDNVANQEVIEAIIENYRLKISILEDILNEMSQFNDECIPKYERYEL